jgi:O-antigen ligase
MAIVVAVARGGVILLAILGLAAASAAVIGLSLRPQDLFLVWLAAAPFVQSNVGHTHAGHAVRVLVYSAPPLLFLLWTLARRRAVPASLVDILPVSYLALVVVSAALSPTQVSPTQLYSTVAIGVIAYYFCAYVSFEGDVFDKVAAILLATGSIVAVLVIVQKVFGVGPAAGFQLDSATSAERAAGTFGNPAVFGTYLGVAFTLALAVLVWDGPRRLRRLSWLTLLVAAPALFMTLTRGPMLAAGSVGLLVLAARSRTRWLAVLGCALAATLVVAAWGSIASSHLYTSRFSNTTNVQARIVIDRWSLDLAKEKPVLGWGFGSFDRVKNASTFSAAPLDRSDLIQYTSHNTFLTVLVETGAVGLFLLLAPWFVVAKSALDEALRPGEGRWELVGLLAVLGVWFVNAGGFDMRFFSFIGAVPWLAVGLLRRRLLDDWSRGHEPISEPIAGTA